MDATCPRCRSRNRAVARFCAACGLPLSAVEGGARGPGRIRHPDPADVPAGYVPCEDAVQVYHRWESALGGTTLLETEGLRVHLFNAGFALQQVVVRIRGLGRDGAVVFDLERSFESLPGGVSRDVEIPSYEMAQPVRALRVHLISAEFEPVPIEAAGEGVPSAEE